MDKRLMLILSVFLFLTGFGKEVFLTKLVGVATTGMMIMMIKLKKGKIRFPAGFGLYIVFLAILSISLVWSWNVTESIEDLLLFVAGGGFWLVSVNMKETFRKYLDQLIIVLGLVFGGIFSYYVYAVVDLPVNCYSLYGSLGGLKNHVLLGDWWAVILVMLTVKLVKKPRNILVWMLMALGVFLLFKSQSRTALVALITGIGYVAVQTSVKVKKILKLVLIVLGSMFLVMSVSKSTLMSRDYYFQSIAGLREYPLGTGLGNFDLISADEVNHVWGRNRIAGNAHSIVFEMVSAVGWLSVVFVFWFYRVNKQALVKPIKKGLVYQAGLLVLSVDMVLMSSYLQPTMLWIWFLLLGITGEYRVKSD